MSKEYLSRFLNMGQYEKVCSVDIVKFVSNDFEIITKKKNNNCILFIDKRSTPHKYFTDLKSAFSSLLQTP